MRLIRFRGWTIRVCVFMDFIWQYLNLDGNSNLINRMLFNCSGISRLYIPWFAWCCSYQLSWILNSAVPCSKQITGSNVNSAFHRSKVEKINLRIFWDLVVKILVGVKLVILTNFQKMPFKKIFKHIEK